jgi:hypothetical protein
MSWAKTKRRIFKAGGKFSEEAAQRYGEALYSLYDKSGKFPTPEEIVEEARSPKSPLHDAFEWQDSVAAHKFRLWQARHMVNHITIAVIKDGKQIQQKAFHSVIDSDDEKGYAPMEIVKERPYLREQVISKAMNEAQDWARRYKEYKELSSVRMAIAKLAKKRS